MTAPSEVRALDEGAATIESDDRNVMPEVAPTPEPEGPRGHVRVGTALGAYGWLVLVQAWRGNR
ncbi:MAG TPA: hypothetical protein VFV10_15885 [Gammaproteobacteria bacterium]|nr:hypothetical protein [Gammaproteobacteria bacterium]